MLSAERPSPLLVCCSKTPFAGMAGVLFALFIVLFMNSASADLIENNGEVYLASESKLSKSKSDSSRQPITIRRRTTAMPKNIGKTAQDEDLAQESVEQERTRRPLQANNYDFGYAVKDAFDGHQFRQEKMNDDGTVHGRFGYRDTKGMFRQVDYMADDFGFRANIKTNEPGTMDLDPANVDINKMHYVNVKRDYHPQDHKKPQQTLKTSEIKHVNHQYVPNVNDDYDESYESKSEDNDEENNHSSYSATGNSPKNVEYQAPRQNRGKAIIYQYFHKQQTAHRGEGVEYPPMNTNPRNVEKISFQYHSQQPNTYVDDNKNIQQLTLSNHLESNQAKLDDVHESPKYEEIDEAGEFRDYVKTPKFSKLMQKKLAFPRHETFEYDPKPRYPVEDNYSVEDENSGDTDTDISHENVKPIPNGEQHDDRVKNPSYHERISQKPNLPHNTYPHDKYLSEPIDKKGYTHFHNPEEYTRIVQLEDVNDKRQKQLHDSSHEEEIHHYGLIRDSTYRQPSRPIPQETPIELNEKSVHGLSYKNQIRSKDHQNKHLSSSQYTPDPKFPTKIGYTPPSQQKFVSTLEYQAPIHKKYFREEVVYGFPVDKNIMNYHNHRQEANYPSYEIVNETSSEEEHSLDFQEESYPNSYQKQESISPTLQQNRKTYLIVRQTQSGHMPDSKQQVEVGSLVRNSKHQVEVDSLIRNPKHQVEVDSLMSNHKHHVELDTETVQASKEITAQQQNTKSRPKFAVLFDPAVFKHFDRFRISGRNADESKWIPIIPQIKWLPRSAPPSTDWVPMPSTRIKRYY